MNTDRIEKRCLENFNDNLHSVSAKEVSSRIRIWKERYQIGMTSVTFRNKTISEIVDIARATKLSYIEWGADRHVPPKDENAINEAVSLMNRYGLFCPSYGSYFRIGEGDTEEFRRICETAKMLGASVVRTWLGCKGSRETSPEKRVSLLIETRHLADIAADYSLTLAFEFHGGTLNDSGASSAAFISECTRDNVRTYWQPLAFGNSEENLRAVLPWLCTVHVFHWDTEYRRYPLIEAKEKWQRYADLIKKEEIPFCPFLLEFVPNDSDAQFLEDVRTLKNILYEA